MQLKNARAKSGLKIKDFITVRKLIQYLMLALFFLLFLLGRGIYQTTALIGSQNLTYLHLFLQFDPLTMIAQFFSNRVFLIGLIPALFILLLTILTGRSWCGWICPVGTILDIFPPRRKNSNSRSIPGYYRKVKYILLLLILFAALFGNLSLLIFDPLTILYRTLSVSAVSTIDHLITSAETVLYQYPILENSVSTVDSMLRPVLLPANPLHYRDSILFLAIFLVIIALNYITPRFWCRYICPLGGLLGIFAKFSIFRRNVVPECKGCGLCQSKCPTGTINPDFGYTSDPSECTMCLECFSSCPRSVINISATTKPARWAAYDPNRRDFLNTFVGSAIMTGVFQASLTATRTSPHNLRPPGTSNDAILSRCIRCGACLRACPTGVIQPAVFEAGLEGLWTPVLVPNMGFCDYTCNACGQICPVQAIPPLALQEKQVQIIGNAYINRDRCIAWSDHTPCIVCEEMCPVPEKAIQLQKVEFTDSEGNPAVINAPYLKRERCIGCGICEFRCPVNGEAAIRVYSANKI